MPFVSLRSTFLLEDFNQKNKSFAYKNQQGFARSMRTLLSLLRIRRTKMVLSKQIFAFEKSTLLFVVSLRWFLKKYMCPLLVFEGTLHAALFFILRKFYPLLCIGYSLRSYYLLLRKLLAKPFFC